jgi:hypothetical protein
MPRVVAVLGPLGAGARRRAQVDRQVAEHSPK